MATSIGYFIGYGLAGNLEKDWKYVLLAPIPLSILRVVMFLSCFRIESHRYIMLKYCKGGDMRREKKARMKVRKILSK